MSVVRLAKHIIDTLGKTEFKPNELISAYEYVLKNMMSTLPKVVLDSLLTKLQKWIQEGGRVEFIQKIK